MTALAALVAIAAGTTERYASDDRARAFVANLQDGVEFTADEHDDATRRAPRKDQLALPLAARAPLIAKFPSRSINLHVGRDGNSIVKGFAQQWEEVRSLWVGRLGVTRRWVSIDDFLES